MKHILLTIPGIRDDGSETTDLLGASIAGAMGWDVWKASYPISHTWHARHRNYNELAAWHVWRELPLDAHVSILAHSYGCLLAMTMLSLAAQKGVEVPVVDSLMLLAPAADRGGQRWGGWSFKDALVLHNPLDVAIMFGTLNPFHPFGSAGAFGFDTNDIRIQQECGWSLKGFWNHTQPYFADGHIDQTADRCIMFLCGRGGNLKKKVD